MKENKSNINTFNDNECMQDQSDKENYSKDKNNCIYIIHYSDTLFLIISVNS